MAKLKLSIIITAWKEPKTIGKAIESFVKQDIKVPYELIAACPDEETREVIRKYQKKYKQIKYFKDPGKGKPIALNMIFKEVKGEILILSDGDVFVNDGCVNLFLKRFEDKKVGAVCGHPIPTNSRNNKFGYWAHLLTSAVHKQRLNHEKGVMACSGYLYSIRAGVVKEIPKDTLSDDALISYMIYNKKYKVIYEPEAIVNVKYPTIFKDWISQKRRSAGGYNQIKYIFKQEVDRSVSKESKGIFFVLRFPRSLKEIFWTIGLVFARIYLWYRIFKDINKNTWKFEDIWTRIESTK
ncbi:MAG: glycosyltransferase [Nanoarchaeota archaeon]|nr:glycosyltransferase [Nanoarchaeota archaeon]